MSILEQAQAFYASSAWLGSLSDDVAAHRQSGYVFATPTVLLLGRPVPYRADDALISDPWQRFDESECDAWFVWFAIGEMSEILSLIPYPKKWIAFGRGGRIRWYEYDGLLTKLRHDLRQRHRVSGHSAVPA